MAQRSVTATASKWAFRVALLTLVVGLMAAAAPAFVHWADDVPVTENDWLWLAIGSVLAVGYAMTAFTVAFPPIWATLMVVGMLGDGGRALSSRLSESPLEVSTGRDWTTLSPGDDEPETAIESDGPADTADPADAENPWQSDSAWADESNPYAAV